MNLNLLFLSGDSSEYPCQVDFPKGPNPIFSDKFWKLITRGKKLLNTHVMVPSKVEETCGHCINEKVDTDMDLFSEHTGSKYGYKNRLSEKLPQKARFTPDVTIVHSKSD